ncbi:biliverdin-producing heme oxygenase [Sphingomonas baiyangensis]|uniref:Biliverdin-producing heme oxygenase n=1 Tax=Sphingomonas baiyangensis TaxID=2572576 RepID=A0A4U1L933_9SPHN|nr:biliverdin-producing heme oxygenase [Sphingomonas baiyangensis]
MRDATRDAHERLDALFMGFDLRDPDGYRRFIGAQAEAMLGIEDALDAAGAGDVLPDWPERRRGHLLAADARALGIAIDPVPIDGAMVAGEARIAAALYVLEGSRHGARHLRRLVPEGAPLDFLDADQPAGNWSKLLAKLDTILYQPASQDVAIVAAREIFGVFEYRGRAWLTKA